MSIRVITIVWDRFPHGGSQLLAMLALADWSDDEGKRLYPSVEGLANKIRMSERQTKRLIEKLIKDKFLELVTPGNLGGRRRSNRYRIRLETLSSCPVVSRETQTSAAKNYDNLSVNPDAIASGEPLEPSEPLPAPGTIQERIVSQRQFIRLLKSRKANPEEIEQHEGILTALIRKRDGGQESLPI